MTREASREGSTAPAAPATPDDVALGARVRATVSGLYRRFRSERPDGALGDVALDVLVRLHKAGPQTLTELAELGRVSPASMSQSVNRLTEGGYAVRTPDPADRRKVRFNTTPAGAALAAAARAQRHAWLDAQLQALGPDDRAAIERACAVLDAVAAS